ncbi:MAG: ferrochelatase, partial [bacterium]
MTSIGLLIMTYGSPETLDDVEEYLTNIRRGNPPPDELLEDFKQRYEAIGGSPLNEITMEQAEATANTMEQALSGVEVKPYMGMRYFHPHIRDTVEQMAHDGIEQAGALIMSPQYSPVLMKDYIDQLEEALEEVENAPEVHLVKDWSENDQYHRSVAQRIEQSFNEVPLEDTSDVPLLLTAHSLPKSAWERDPDYVDKLKNTADAIAGHLDHENWDFAYQSAGHTKEEWLKPDMTDLFPGMVEEGHE